MKNYKIILLIKIFVCVIKFLHGLNVSAPDFGILIGSTFTEWSNKVIYQFLAVRYARSTSGQNRFKVKFKKKFITGCDNFGFLT